MSKQDIWQGFQRETPISGYIRPMTNGIYHDRPQCTEEAMNNNNPRDTQFMGFAKALLAEVLAADGVVIEPDNPNWPEEQLIIARRVYDLIDHACEAIEDKQWEYDSRLSSWHMRTSIPDLPVLPEEKQQNG